MPKWRMRQGYVASQYVERDVIVEANDLHEATFKVWNNDIESTIKQIKSEDLTSDLHEHVEGFDSEIFGEEYSE